MGLYYDVNDAMKSKTPDPRKTTIGTTYGTKEFGFWPRRALLLVHLLLLGLTVWICLAGGYQSLVGSVPGPPGRRLALSVFALVLFLRTALQGIILLKRRLPWEEAGGVALAVSIYTVGFGFLGAGAAAPLSLLDTPALLLFGFGMGLTLVAEVQRHRFKQDPANIGKLYTEGLFGVVRHPNYLGDLLWVGGWALLTRSWVALLVPLLLGIAFVTYFIPALSSYLAARYGEDYARWSAHTPRLVPWLY